MSVLIAGVVLAGLLCLLDLVLTLGVIKRLREHTELLARANSPRTALAPGERVGEFATSTLDGRRLAQADLGAETLVAFFSPTCEPCEEKIPGFLDFAREFPGGRDRVLAVVVGDPAEANWRVEDFFDVARVVVEPAEGAVSTAFGVRGFPSVLITGPGPDGVPVVTTDDVRLTAPATA
ncbi:TlpA disulfide reductase family protein [Amycolatopsis sp. YIM 10]|uniref:TlpA disulfide reductase family protein n=1 Tax=Amycolatopsis sp. YIM 10 TaxID=2653857 RepID=UPI0012905AEC|nr:TlpA disulfide reductase family protein [Amycolatopsis sp. YIM 10]QFU92692.1 Thiol-disulfide oxidoreductase ResA [Amycolatopsis sp. YIM 10]